MNDNKELIQKSIELLDEFLAIVRPLTNQEYQQLIEIRDNLTELLSIKMDR